MIFDGDTIEKEGYLFKVFLPDDDSNTPPWEDCEGHGPVTEWVRRDKKPGEWLLNSDHGSKRFYDAQEANKIAKRDGWGLSDEAKASLLEHLCRPIVYWVDGKKQTTHHRDPNKPLTPGEIRAEAVRLDYEFLRGWCNDDWNYIGVCVMCLGKVEDDPDTDVALDHSESKDLWGIESNSGDYLETIAHEHIDEFLCELAAERDADAREAAEAMYWAQRDSLTGTVHFYVR